MTATTVGASAPRGGVLDHVTLHHVVSLEELDAFRRWIGERHDGMVCTDTESSGLNPHSERHRMTQLGDKLSGWAFRPDWMGAAHETMARWPGRLGVFNGPYDTRVLGHQSGLWLDWSRLDDAQLAAHLVDSAAPTALKPRASRDVDPTALAWDRQLSDAMRKNHWDYATVPDDYPGYWMYGAADCVLTSHLLDKHLPTVRQRWPASYDIEMGYARLCASMSSAGMMIDRPYIAEWTAKLTAYYEQAMAWLGPYGITSVEANADVGAALELAGVPIGPRTRTGQPKVDKATLEDYQAEYPFAADLIKTIRGAKKAASLLSRTMGKFARMAIGDTVHASINSIGAQRTGRSSVSAPSMQNLDRDFPMVRGCFIPRPGYRFLAIDASQIELRLSAHISQDRALLAEIARCDENGLSFFLEFAGKVYGKITKSDPRYTTTKSCVYSMTYGAGPKTAAAAAGVPVSQIKPVYDGFKYAYPTLAKRSHELVSRLEHSRRRPAVTTLYGRELMVDRGKEHAGVDYEVQGSAAELMKVGGIKLDAAGLGEFLRLSIHDEWLLEVPEHQAADILHAATEILTDRTSLSLPILWEGKVMDGRWTK